MTDRGCLGAPARPPARPWLAAHASRLAALAPLPPGARLDALNAWARAGRVASGSGRPLRFVADGPDEGAARGPHEARVAYEARVFDDGEVSTRIEGRGARHDLYNALAWLAWPRTKAWLNALHAGALAGAARAGPRGPLRDAATLFDENGALWVGTDPALEDALRAFDWRALFVERRVALVAAVRVHVFGHALLEKLDAPFKGITAHAWPLRLPADAPPDALDAALAASLQAGLVGALAAGTSASRAFCPLPVMGLPGWCEGNADPAFYNDATVFRPGRRRPDRAHDTETRWRS